MKCPKCSAEMIPQTNKTNEKAPDWKCSDKNCKWRWNYKTKEWEKSDYITGAWNEKSKPSDTGMAILVDRVAGLEERIIKIEKALRERWGVEVNG